MAVIGGDGIGPEVCAEALKVVGRRRRRRSTPPTTTSAPPATCATGEVLPDATLDELRGFDAILLGAVGPPIGDTRCRPGPSSGVCCCACASSSTSTSTCGPSPACPGRSPPGADFVVVRENTEGTYAGEGGFLRKGTPHEVATQGSVNTRMGVERCVRFAFELAERRRAHASRSCTRRTCSPSPATCGSAPSTRWRAEYPDVERGLQPRRRRLHLPRRAAGPLRRHRHRQPLRRHPHRPRRRGGRRDRLRRLGQPQPGPHRPVAVRAGARRRARHRRHRASPTRSPPSARPR